MVQGNASTHIHVCIIKIHASSKTGQNSPRILGPNFLLAHSLFDYSIYKRSADTHTTKFMHGPNASLCLPTTHRGVSTCSSDGTIKQAGKVYTYSGKMLD